MSEQLSTNFWRSEWACKCGCGLDNIDLRLMPIAEIIRHHEGDKPLSINSACRCLQHNERVQMDANEHYVPYSSRSKHLPFDKDNIIDEETGLCTAGDFPSENPLKLYKFLCDLLHDTYAIGLYNWGVHVDTRMAKARWGKV